MTDLRDVLTSPDDVGAVLTATIASIDADGTVGVDFGGGRTVDRCAVLSVYTPVMGDSVQVLRRDASSFLVLGAVRDFNATSVSVSASLAFPYNVYAPLPSTPTPSTGTLVVPATAIRSWRDNEGWSGASESNSAAQGAYSTRWGYYRGCYFYGSAFSSLKGATCTRLRIRLHRKGAGGIAGPENVYLALHAHASIPSGAPYFTTGARRVGSLAWNDTAEFDLPVSWGQALINGTAKGIGHLYLGTADYAVFHGLGTDSLSGRLTLDWKE